MYTFEPDDPMARFDAPVMLPPDAPKVTTTVYSLYYPETRHVIDAVWRKRPHGMFERNYLKRQDAMHQAYLDQWRTWSGLGLGDAFPHAYPTAGASEAIAHLIMNRLVTPTRVHLFQGDYEGYVQTAKASGIRSILHDLERPFAKQRYLRPGDVFWISNPSAIDGEYWTGFDGWCREMLRNAPGVRIFLDVTYVGAVKRLNSIGPASHPNVAAVVFSLSKPFGVYYHRVGGVVSRKPIDSLWPNRWFKILPAIRIGAALMANFAVDHLPMRYASTQEKIVRELQAAGTIPPDAVPANVVLLARGPNGPETHRRTDGQYRFCVSPGMDQFLKGEWR